MDAAAGQRDGELNAPQRSTAAPTIERRRLDLRGEGTVSVEREGGGAR